MQVGPHHILLAVLAQLLLVVRVHGEFAPATAVSQSAENRREATDMPAFPGAEGFGAYARGGRGGRVAYVTTLSDYNRRLGERIVPGSLRWAVEELKGRRTILFQTGGTIFLKTGLVLRGEGGSYVTIAGQSAPGDGVQLAGYGLTISEGAHDIVLRYLRIRPGVTDSDLWTDPDGVGPLPPYLRKWDTDSLTIYGNGNRTVHDIIVDHCSLEWAIDENVGIAGVVERVTIQHCILAEGATFGHYGHPEAYPYPHSCGLLAGFEASKGSDQYLTLYRNLFMHNNGRNPLIAANGCVVEVVNNLLYNCQGEVMCVVRLRDSRIAASPRVNIIGNHYLWGPDDSARRRRMMAVQIEDAGGTLAVDDASIYSRDNLHGHVGPGVNQFAALCDPRGRARGPADSDDDRVTRKQRGEPWPTRAVPLRTENSESVLAAVSRSVGADHPRWDTVDARLMKELAARSGRTGFGPQDAPLRHPTLEPGRPIEDSDADGMPDAYERRVGLGPNDPSDGNRDRNGDGHTELEDYLHSLVSDQDRGPD